MPKEMTAIRQAIANLEQQRKSLKEMDLLGVLMDNEYVHKSNQINTTQLMLASLLPVEKEQHIETYDRGSDVDEDLKPLYGSGEHYFNQKFTQ